MRKITKIIVHHSASKKYNLFDAVNVISSWHKKLHWFKNGLGFHTAYHFLITDNGDIGHTRPINEVGYHCGNFWTNRRSLGICLIGNFEFDQPTKDQLDSLKRLIKMLKVGVNSNIEVFSHSDIKPTLCCGKNLYSKLKNLT